MVSSGETIRTVVLDLLKETFQSVNGYYLDRKTSILEALEKIDYTEASAKKADITETIAGHVDHLRFYIVVLQEYMSGTRTGKTDWNESRQTESVTEQTW